MGGSVVLRPLMLIALFLASSNLSPMEGQAVPVKFEVVSVRQVPSHSLEDLVRGIGVMSISEFPTNLYTAKNITLGWLVAQTFGVDSSELEGGPGFLDSQLYDVTAKVDGDTKLTLDQMRPLLRELLEKRFRLATHREEKLISGFALVVAKSGAKLTPSKGTLTRGQIIPNEVLGFSMSTKTLAGMLVAVVKKPVVDKTEIEGLFDFQVRFLPEGPAGENWTGSPLPSIYTAIQEQLGLKLEPQKVPVSFLVIDHLDKVPTDN